MMGQRYGFSCVLTVCFVIALATASSSFAERTMGERVDAFCQASDPFSGDCALCHGSTRGEPTPEKDAYLSGDWCSFCPDDPACGGGGCTDFDGDGWCVEDGDCNDRDATLNPGLAEVCNDGKDNDCNNWIDSQDPACEAAPCKDDDGDGWCVEDGDCDDANPDIYPGGIEVCNDGIDQDCSGKDKTKGKGCSRTLKVESEGKGKTCSDGVDNDEDGLLDCADSDCTGNRACRP